MSHRAEKPFRRIFYASLAGIIFTIFIVVFGFSVRTVYADAPHTTGMQVVMEMEEPSSQEAGVQPVRKLAAQSEQDISDEQVTARSVVDFNTRKTVAGGRHTTALTICIILAIIVLIIIIGILVVSRSQAKIREKEQRLARVRGAGNVDRRSAYYRNPYSRVPTENYRANGNRGNAGNSTNTGSARTAAAPESRRSSNGSYGQDQSRVRQRSPYRG